MKISALGWTILGSALFVAVAACSTTTETSSGTDGGTTEGGAGTGATGGAGGTGGAAGSTAGAGGGSATCTPADGGDACNVCANQKCCKEIKACEAKKECGVAFTCFLGSDAGDWSARQMACMAAGSPGDVEFNDMISCVYDPKNGQCGTVCN
jgi:hypothetical protein